MTSVAIRSNLIHCEKTVLCGNPVLSSCLKPLKTLSAHTRIAFTLIANWNNPAVKKEPEEPVNKETEKLIVATHPIQSSTYL
ncbi:uncharacterized protein N7529_006853 [Penicillium soppii]|uniref:uncharacterized protein n=1 Tax=Penicillium soppii TaxID=69789 RepID=UPI002547168E|nr:uncharacterized protein N7529_006853 [Penicillium soppii]KAJ5864937.1 hypothetical protein N7529_006853 [Penicillium soppii]